MRIAPNPGRRAVQEERQAATLRVQQYVDAVGDAASGGGGGAAAAVRALSQPPRLAQKEAREVRVAELAKEREDRI